MPYIAVTYPSSTRPYTFYTSDHDIQPGDTVLVKDKKGFSLCTTVNYVKKPSFPCSVVILTQDEMVEKMESQLLKMAMENVEEDDEETDGDEYA